MLTFLGACMAGDPDRVRELRAADPGIAAEAIAREPDVLVDAAEADRPAAVRLLVQAGYDVDTLRRGGGYSPLHGAAWNGHLDMVRLLLELGADPAAEDLTHHGTPADWAAHNHQTEVAIFLATRTDPSRPARAPVPSRRSDPGPRAKRSRLPRPRPRVGQPLPGPQSIVTRPAASGCCSSQARANEQSGTTVRCSAAARSTAALTSSPPRPWPPSASGTPVCTSTSRSARRRYTSSATCPSTVSSNRDASALSVTAGESS